MRLSWFGTRVQISRTALQFIRATATLSDDGREVGGILLGTDSPSSSWLYSDIATIRHAGGPGPAAVRERSSFRRDLAHSQQVALEAFERDGSEWIGEWHTHPIGPARPSAVDIRSYRRHLADEALGLDRFVSLILTPERRIVRGRPITSWDRIRVGAFVVRRISVDHVSMNELSDTQAVSVMAAPTGERE